MFSKLFLFIALAIGPWVTDMGKDRFSVLWTTDSEGLGWVQLEDGTRVYDEFAGRRMHGTFHHVRLTGFKPGEKVVYSIGAQKLVDNTNPRKPVYGEETLKGPFAVTTFNPSCATCRFSIVNDMHMDTQLFSKLICDADTSALDFIFLNGDLISAGHHPLDTLVKYEIGPLGSLCASIPVAFARGNHEGRGDGVRNVAAVFPKESPFPFTYIFREGPAAFLVLDAGETHTRNSRVFCGKDVYEDYINSQLDWAEKAVRCSEWRTAKVKIVLSHVTMHDFNQSDVYSAVEWLAYNALPRLNRLGVDLMINADMHEYFYFPENSAGNAFPIIVNDNKSRVDVSIDGRKVKVEIRDANGVSRSQQSFPD